MNDYPVSVILTDEVRTMRVAVARDVIDQVRAHHLNIQKGKYFSWIGELDFDHEQRLNRILWEAKQSGRDLKSVLDEVVPYCRVCARGALMLSKARLYDAVPVDFVGRDHVGENSFCLETGQATTSDALHGVFDVKTLAAIEAAFEMTDYHDIENEYLDEEEGSRAIEFGEANCGPHEHWSREAAEARVIAVMENLITNNGEFLP